jgi:hypothetical protein
MADNVVERYKTDETEQNFDAELMKEAIAEGETKEINVDTSADYEVAKQMSESSVSAKQAEDMVAPQFAMTQPEDVQIGSTSDNDSVDYMDMAKDITETPAGSGNVTDDLVEKALEMGQPGG